MFDATQSHSYNSDSQPNTVRASSIRATRFVSKARSIVYDSFVSGVQNTCVDLFENARIYVGACNGRVLYRSNLGFPGNLLEVNQGIPSA